jgi:3-isopropylmalate/(R)-2-methylmalate dehydratase small subunit
MTPFAMLTAVAAPFETANIDTDQLFPSRFGKKLRTPNASYGPYLFYDLRFDADGREKPDFVLNQAPYRNAAILVAGANFGCGSSREAAVYALVDSGVRAVIAPSFGDIHYANQLQNGMLPMIVPDGECRQLREQLRAHPGAKLSIDLAAQCVTGSDGEPHHFEIDAMHKERLLQGLDEIGLVLQYTPDIERFEKRYHTEMPWLIRGRDERIRR